MHLNLQIRKDPLPSSKPSELQSILSSIPLHSSAFLQHPNPYDFIRTIRYAIRTFHRNNPHSHMSAYLVSAPGQPSRGTSVPIGVQVWHNPRSLRDGVSQ